MAPVCAFGLFVLFAAGMSRLPPALLARNLRSFLWLLVITALLHAFNTPGEPLWRVPWLDLQTTREGLQSAALFTLRLATVVTAAALLTLTTSPLELTDGLERLLRPLRRLRVPSHELAMTISVTLRLSPPRGQCPGPGGGTAGGTGRGGAGPGLAGVRPLRARRRGDLPAPGTVLGGEYATGGRRPPGGGGPVGRRHPAGDRRGGGDDGHSAGG